jgi:DNA repair protein RadC
MRSPTGKGYGSWLAPFERIEGDKRGAIGIGRRARRQTIPRRGHRLHWTRAIGGGFEFAAPVDHIIVTAAQVHHIMSEDAIGRLADKPASYMLRCPPEGQAHDPDVRILQNARIVARRRLLRRQLLGAPDLFGEPAWDMLLDLFIQQCEGKLLPMSSLCLSANIPNSSAMKLIQRLCDAGLLERLPDHRDGRRSLIRISPDTEHRLRAYFAEGTE